MDFKKTMDDAIKTCDKVEYDPQDIKYSERSIKGTPVCKHYA